MSLELPPETLARLRDDGRPLVERTSEHQQCAEALVSSAERDVRQAEAAAVDVPNADVDQLRHPLGDAGFVVRTATNGLEGLVAAYAMRPGVVVMDVSMPVLNGIEATPLIKAGEATRHARVIAYTGTPPEDTSVQSLFAAVLQKPASPDVVLATVQHVAAL